MRSEERKASSFIHQYGSVKIIYPPSTYVEMLQSWRLETTYNSYISALNKRSFYIQHMHGENYSGFRDCDGKTHCKGEQPFTPTNVPQIVRLLKSLVGEKEKLWILS